jgi:hypothetical protein
MKLKYFNVLTENESQKQQISELIEYQITHDAETQQLNKEKEKQNSDIYSLRMDITKRIDQLNNKTELFNELQKDNERLTHKCSQLIMSNREFKAKETKEAKYIDLIS